LAGIRQESGRIPPKAGRLACLLKGHQIQFNYLFITGPHDFVHSVYNMHAINDLIDNNNDYADNNANANANDDK